MAHQNSRCVNALLILSVISETLFLTYSVYMLPYDSFNDNYFVNGEPEVFLVAVKLANIVVSAYVILSCASYIISSRSRLNMCTRNVKAKGVLDTILVVGILGGAIISQQGYNFWSVIVFFCLYVMSALWLTFVGIIEQIIMPDCMAGEPHAASEAVELKERAGHDEELNNAINV